MHTHLALAVLFAVFIWWFSTGLVLLLTEVVDQTPDLGILEGLAEGGHHGAFLAVLDRVEQLAVGLATAAGEGVLVAVQIIEQCGGAATAAVLAMAGDAVVGPDLADALGVGGGAQPGQGGSGKEQYVTTDG